MTLTAAFAYIGVVTVSALGGLAVTFGLFWVREFVREWRSLRGRPRRG